MPYITQGGRRRREVQPSAERPAADGGELNFQIACLIDGYVKEHGLSYATISDIRAAGAGAVDEFNRRFAHPYEDEKIEANGEVFGATRALRG